MKIAILAGGLGTRLSEYTSTIPKPMVKIGKYPILIHIINLYLKNDLKDFYILAGYKSHIIKKYFKNFKKINTPFKFRLKKMMNFLKDDEKFMFTYGDGISNISIKKLLKFHKKNKKMITVTTVRPPARFGEIKIKKNIVTSFKEKPQASSSWINGGFFIANKEFLKSIKNEKTILEKEPLENAAKKNQLLAYKHKGFWKCMDTLRDKLVLEDLHKKNFF